MKRLTALVVPILGCLLVTQSAGASGPTIVRYPNQYYDYVDDFCGFDVHVQGTGSKVDISWDGVRLIQAFPQANQVDTNVETGYSIHVNLTGGDRINLNPDGSGTLVGWGNWVWPYNPYTGERGFFVTSGKFVYTLDSQGNLTFSIVGGITEDLCAKLAA